MNPLLIRFRILVQFLFMLFFVSVLLAFHPELFPRAMLAHDRSNKSPARQATTPKICLACEQSDITHTRNTYMAAHHSQQLHAHP